MYPLYTMIEVYRVRLCNFTNTPKIIRMISSVTPNAQ